LPGALADEFARKLATLSEVADRNGDMRREVQKQSAQEFAA
jgi:hypothetical protein